MKQLLTNIQNRLASATASAEDGERKLFAYVDIDWGQTDFYGDMPPVKFPCALIDVQSATFSDEGNLVQMGDVIVQVRIVDMILSHSSAQAPQGQREKASRMFDLVGETHRLLHGWTGNRARHGLLTRKTLARTRRRDGLHEYVLTFEVVVTDDTARPARQTAKISSVKIQRN